MTANSVVPELDVFKLPVFADANIFPMIPQDELAELAEDIKENGLNEPLVVGQINGEWMLIDGRNRLAACKLVGIIPTYRIVEADADKFKSLVWSWNGPRRHLSSSQKAMAYAMMYPEGEKGGRGKKLLQNCNSLEMNATEKSNASRARFILKNDPDKAYLVRDGHPDFPLSKTYDAVKSAVEDRQREAEEQRQKLEKLTALRSAYPDLASLVDEGRIYLDEAIDTAEKRTQKAQEEAERFAREQAEALDRIAREAAEKERREQEEEDARLAEEDRIKRETERKDREYYEQCREGHFNSLNNLISGAVIACNATQVSELPKYRGEWDAFSQRYRHKRQYAIDLMKSLHENLPAVIAHLETM